MEYEIHSVADLAPYAFWDTDVSALDLETDRDLIVCRIFERARLEDVLKTIVYYGVETCASALVSNKYLSSQGMYLGHLLLSLPLEKFKAYASIENNH